MIDLGLAKLALIGAVALIVIGPEKLPKVARMAGSLLGRAQRYLNDVKREVSREMELDELRKMQQEVEKAATDAMSSVTSGTSSVAREIEEIEQSIHSINPSAAINQPLPDEANIARKARAFRRKKLVRQSALPAWYKQQQGCKSHLLSASARVARYRPSGPFATPSKSTLNQSP